MFPSPVATLCTILGLTFVYVVSVNCGSGPRIEMPSTSVEEYEEKSKYDSYRYAEAGVVKRCINLSRDEECEVTTRDVTSTGNVRESTESGCCELKVTQGEADDKIEIEYWTCNRNEDGFGERKKIVSLTTSGYIYGDEDRLTAKDDPTTYLEVLKTRGCG